MARSCVKNRVGDVPESLSYVGVVHRDRLVTAVGARHDLKRRAVCEEQLVKRRRRKHEADLLQSGRNSLERMRGASQRNDDNRARRRSQELTGSVGDAGYAFDFFDVTRHHCQGLVRALLAHAQETDRARVTRIGRKKKTANTLHCDDAAARHCACGGPERVVAVEGQCILL